MNEGIGISCEHVPDEDGVPADARTDVKVVTCTCMELQDVLLDFRAQEYQLKQIFQHQGLAACGPDSNQRFTVVAELHPLARLSPDGRKKVMEEAQAAQAAQQGQGGQIAVPQMVVRPG